MKRYSERVLRFLPQVKLFNKKEFFPVRTASLFLVAILFSGYLVIIPASSGRADTPGDFILDAGSSDEQGPKIIEYVLPTKNSVPTGIGGDSKGRIWYTAQSANKIGYFDTKTKQVKEFVIPSTAALPKSDWKYDPINKEAPKPEDVYTISGVGSPGELIVDSKDRIWFVQHMGNSIGMFDPETEKFVEYNIPTPNSHPYSLAADDKNNIWFVEWNSNKIGKLDFSLKKIVEYALPDGRHRLSSIAIDKDQNIWVANIADNSIGLFSPSESKIKRHPIYDPMAQPQGLFAGSQGVWFALAKAHKIAMLDPPTGLITTAIMPGYNSVPLDVVEDNAGRVWYVDSMRNKVGYFDSQKVKFFEWDIPTQNSQPIHLTVSGNGDIWFVESGMGANKIAQVVVSSLPKEGEQKAEGSFDSAGELERGDHEDEKMQNIFVILAFIILAMAVVFLAIKFSKK